jgi:hypothetical protein
MMHTAALANPLGGPSELWDRSPEELCQLLVAAAEASIPYLVEYARRPVQSRHGTILEGERIHPRLVTLLEREHRCAGVFILETEAQRLYDTLLSRSSSFRALTESRRRSVTEVDRLYGLWVRQECARLGLPCIASQPWESMASRLLERVNSRLEIRQTRD